MYSDCDFDYTHQRNIYVLSGHMVRIAVSAFSFVSQIVFPMGHNGIHVYDWKLSFLALFSKQSKLFCWQVSFHKHELKSK